MADDLSAPVSATAAAAAAAVTVKASAGRGPRKKQRVQEEEHIPVVNIAAKLKGAAALKRKSDLAEGDAALPVYFVKKEGRAQIRAAVGAMVLTTEFGKKYKCLWVYRCV